MGAVIAQASSHASANIVPTMAAGEYAYIVHTACLHVGIYKLYYNRDTYPFALLCLNWADRCEVGSSLVYVSEVDLSVKCHYWQNMMVTANLIHWWSIAIGEASSQFYEHVSAPPAQPMARWKKTKRKWSNVKNLSSKCCMHMPGKKRFKKRNVCVDRRER